MPLEPQWEPHSSTLSEWQLRGAKDKKDKRTPINLTKVAIKSPLPTAPSAVAISAPITTAVQGRAKLPTTSAM
jgi:hypothetical protein